MATLQQKIEAERETRAMLIDNDLQQPDEVEYGHTCIRLLWHDPKAVVIVQIDEPPPGFVFAEDMSEEQRKRLRRERGRKDVEIGARTRNPRGPRAE